MSFIDIVQQYNSFNRKVIYIYPIMQTKLTLPVSLELQHCYQLPYIELEKREEKNAFIASQENVNLFIKSSLPARTQKFYPPDFVKLYLLIKINSLAKKECAINDSFLSQIITLYNDTKLNQIGVSSTQAELITQILNKVEGALHLSAQQLVSISQGNGLLAASSVWLIKNADLFLLKQQFAFCLSFVALGGRQMAFTPIVHEEKYHKGQIYFAKRVNQLFHLKQKSVKQQIKVQDPYSMRCSPQVYGVSYDCLSQLKKKVTYLLNKSHVKNVVINGLTLPNILRESDTYALKMDFLLCSLQQIGSTMFLRTERILNEYLGKNKLKQGPEYASLLSMLKSAKSCTSKNKILSQMTNFDTINVDSYNQDIFYDSASYFNKITEIFNNLYSLLTLELLSSIQAIRLIYKGQQKARIEFINEAMQDNYNLLDQNMSTWKKSESIIFVEQIWLKK